MAPPPDLWSLDDESQWRATLARYPDVIESQGVSSLATLDRWYCDELPAAIRSREQPHVTLDELVRVTEWKMARGIWRARNLALVKANQRANVVEVSGGALDAVPHPTSPISTLAKLDGVGPATASAVVAAYAPRSYPFFDELVAAQVPGLGPVAWTLGYYARYAEALRERASALGKAWTPVMVERALWAHVGGKTGIDSD